MINVKIKDEKAMGEREREQRKAAKKLLMMQQNQGRRFRKQGAVQLEEK